MISTLLAAEGGGFGIPPLEEMFEFPAFLFENAEFLGMPLGFNRTSLLIWISVLVLSALMIGAFYNAKVVPGKFQAIMEAIVGFVRDYIVMEVMGPPGLKYVPFLTTLFLFILFNNFYEIIPLVQFPTTSRMALPAFLAITVWTMFVLVGSKEQGGLWTYIKNSSLPSGVPMFVRPLVIPIEVVSTFVVRPLTLSIRLMANMLAGHILLAITFIASSAFLFNVHEASFNMKGAPIGFVAVLVGPAVVAFEALIDLLQAYIFVILAAVYFNSSMYPEQH